MGLYFLRNFLFLRVVDLDNCPSLVPFVRVGSSLVLNSDLITDVKGWEEFGVFFPFFVINHVTVSQGFLSG